MDKVTWQRVSCAIIEGREMIKDKEQKSIMIRDEKKERDEEDQWTVGVFHDKRQVYILPITDLVESSQERML